MKEITAKIIASLMNAVGIVCFLGLVSVFYGPLDRREFAAMAVLGIVLAVVVFLVWFAGMALRWALGGEVDHD